MQPDPGQKEHDQGDGETEDKPGPEVDHLRLRVPAAERQEEDRSSAQRGRVYSDEPSLGIISKGSRDNKKRTCRILVFH